MKPFIGARLLRLARAISVAALCIFGSFSFFSFPYSPLHADALDSALDAAAGQGAYANPDMALLDAGSTPRRLSFSAAMINFATQVATSSEIRQLMGQWSTMMGEIFKGPDTSESNLPYFWKVPECVLTVDFSSVAELGVADSAKIALAYTPVHNAIMLAYIEEAAEWIQVLKRPIPRLQFLHLPAECMVDENTTYSSFCMNPKGKCFMARLNINLTKISRQDMNVLKPIPTSDFIQQQMEQGVMYDDVVDVLEAPTAVGRLLFEPLTCIMHTRVQAAGTNHIYIYHNPLDHSLRVDAQNSDSSWFRKKVILPLGCGGTEAKDFTSVVHLQPDGHYKVLIKATIARDTDQDRSSQDNIEIKNGNDIRPIEGLKFGEHDPNDLYPDAKYDP